MGYYVHRGQFACVLCPDNLVLLSHEHAQTTDQLFMRSKTDLLNGTALINKMKISTT